MCFTTQAEFKLRKPVALHSTYEVVAEITKVGMRGLRISIAAKLLSARDKEVAAECSVQLVNMAKLARRKE